MMLIQVLPNMFVKTHWHTDELELMPSPHPHGKTRTFVWIMGIFAFTAMHFLMNFPPVHLHDIAHFATAGVNLIRDQKDLLYPYHPHAPGGLGPAYEFFQNNTIHFDIRTNYPSKLYSAIYGIICTLNGSMQMQYIQWMAFAGFFISNFFLYLIASRFVQGLELVCVLLSIVFLPLMRALIAPGNDTYGYAGSLALLWLCLCLRINPFLLGLCAGILTHFRSQMLFTLIIFPFFFAATTRRSYFRGLITMSAGFTITYLAMACIIAIIITSTAASNPVGFYVNHFRSAIYSIDEIGLSLNKFCTAIINLFDIQQLFIYAGLVLLCAMRRNAPLQRSLAIASLVYVALPIILYSMERFTLPSPRYYIFAVPMTALSVIIGLKTLPENFLAISLKVCMCILATISLLAWHNTWGFSLARLNNTSITSRAQFLDFDGVENALATSFKDDDFVIINHALPTGLSRLHNIIYIPSYKVFQNGDNRKIKGLLFVYSHTPPNNFFEPKDWLQEGMLPLTINDLHGISFKQVYAQTSKVKNPDGSDQAEAYFYIYINISEQ